MYLLAIVLPPVAVLLCGRPLSALLNFVLWCCLIIPGVIHACMVVGEAKQQKRDKRQSEEADRRQERLVKAMRSR